MARPAARAKHRHRWTAPHLMSTVGYVKACRAKHCPTPMKAVRLVEAPKKG